MKRASNYLRMRVLGALEHAAGDSLQARYRAVSELTFTDEALNLITRASEGNLVRYT